MKRPPPRAPVNSVEAMVEARSIGAPEAQAVKIKICGITNLADARLAADAGADYLGFVFYPPSKRSISAASARGIISELRSLPGCPMLVGVFVNESAEAMAQVMDFCGLDLAQLSGQETPALIGEPSSPIYGRSYKALHPTSFGEAEAEAEWYLPPAPRPRQPLLLVDSYHPTLPGGTGRTGDWEVAAKLAATTPGLMLAGGLEPGNVSQAILEVRPFAVDVASGVEATPGHKSAGKVRAFVDAVVTTAATGTS